MQSAVDVGDVLVALFGVGKLLERADDGGNPVDALRGSTTRGRCVVAQELQVTCGFGRAHFGDQAVMVSRVAHTLRRLVVRADEVAQSAHRLGEEVDVVAHELNRRVNLMSDASCELPHGLELLHSPELGFALLAGFELLDHSVERFGKVAEKVDLLREIAGGNLLCLPRQVSEIREQRLEGAQHRTTTTRGSSIEIAARAHHGELVSFAQVVDEG